MQNRAGPFLLYRKINKNEINKFIPIDTAAETEFYTMSVHFLVAKVMAPGGFSVAAICPETGS